MIYFSGDLFLGTNNSINLSKQLIEKLDKKDNIIVINLESVVIDGSLQNTRPDKSSILYTDKKSFLFFINQFKHSTLYFNIGNNHLHDYGDLGIKKTIEFFDKLKINYFGVISKNLDKSSTIIYYKNLRLKLTSVSTDSIDVMSVISKKEKFYIKDYKKPSFDYQTSNQFDLEIILPHWGKEYINFPRKEIIDYSKEWLNLGVDYIIGNHPHVIQASLNDKVFFGLGNFLF